MNITTSLTNLTYSGDTTITTTATGTLTAASGYYLPVHIRVENADYEYNLHTGVITLSNATDDVTIVAAGLDAQTRYDGVLDALNNTINEKAGTSGKNTVSGMWNNADGIPVVDYYDGTVITS